MNQNNLKAEFSLAAFLEKLTAFNFQSAVLFIQWVPPQVHHASSCGCDSRREIATIYTVSWSMAGVGKIKCKFQRWQNWASRRLIQPKFQQKRVLQLWITIFLYKPQADLFKKKKKRTKSVFPKVWSITYLYPNHLGAFVKQAVSMLQNVLVQGGMVPGLFISITGD